MTQSKLDHPFDPELVGAANETPSDPGDSAVKPPRWIRSPEQVRQAQEAGRTVGPQPIVAMSNVAVVAWLPMAWLFPRLTLRSVDKVPEDQVTVAKERTRTTLRLLAQLTADFGQLLPVVGVIGPDPAMDAEHGPFVDAVRLWPTQQDWHRGEFALYVEETVERLARRCRDVLSPHLPSVEHFQPRTRANQLAQLAEAVKLGLEGGGTGAGAQEEAHQLIERWLSAIEGVEVKDKTNKAIFDERLNQALRAMEEWLRPDSYLQNLQGGSSPSQTSNVYPPQPDGLTGDQNHVRRVHAVDLARIRGWTGDGITPTVSGVPGLFTNADIVLINAPNGRGKSSLLHALSLAITGRAPDDEHGSVSFGPGVDGKVRQRQWPGGIKVYHGPDKDHQTDLLHAELNGGKEEGWGWKMADREQIFTRPDVLNEAVRGPDAHPRPGATHNRWWPGTMMHRMLQYRLTSYFPEHVRDQFDHVQPRATLVSHLRPQLEAFRILQEAAQGLLTNGGAIDRLVEDSRREAKGLEDQRVTELFAKVEESIEPLRTLLGDTSYQHLPANLRKDLDAVGNAVAGILAAKAPQHCLEHAKSGGYAPMLPDVASLIRSVDVALLHEKQGGTPEAGTDEEMERFYRDLFQVRERIARMTDGHSSDELGAWVALLNAGAQLSADDEELPLLLRVVDGIQRLRESIPSNPPGDPDALRIHQELSLVRLEQLADIERFATKLHERHRVEVAEIHALRKREAALVREIATRKESAETIARRQAILSLRAGLEEWASAGETSRMGDRWTTLSSAWKNWSSLAFDTTRQDRLNRYLSHADWLDKKAKAAVAGLAKGPDGADDADRTLSATINNSVQQVLGRFAIAATPTLSDASVDLQQESSGGEIHRYRDISLANGLLHEAEFSTGMRTQVAIAELVGQKLVALSETLPMELRVPNRVILLDDVSSSYDLTNLVRESLLWRQLAFHPDPKQRLQIFIGTHHETMTNRLYDLLTPPQGCRVIVHQITDWSVEKGPTVESFELAACDTPNWADLAATLHQELS